MNNGMRTWKRYTQTALLLLSVLLPLTCWAQEEGDEFLIGLIPEENIFRQLKKHKPLEEYLTEKLGVKVTLTILSRYPDIIDRFTIRDLDGAFFGIFTAALAHENLGVVPIARPVNNSGSTTAQGCLFVRKDSGITSAAAMKNKKIAFVDMATATGYLFALSYLKENGISDIDAHFSDTFFTGSHDTAVYTVLSGRADIGVAKCRILQKLSMKDPLIIDEIDILSRSLHLPDNTLSIRSDLSPEFKRKLKTTLLMMHKDPKGREVLKKLEALKFIPADWSEFNAVKELCDKAGINIKRYQYR
jgi:phosphonate transport system substrate-binding protein